MRDLIIIVAIVVVALVGARIVSRDKTDNGIETTGGYETSGMGEVSTGTETASGTPSKSAASVPVTPGISGGSAETIKVATQNAGDQVVIESVIFTRPGWVAVHESRAGKLGNVLGAAWLPAGTHANVPVTLLRGTTAGASYFAVLYEDNGNKQYDHGVDVVVKDSLGNPIAFQFMTNAQ